MPGRYIAAGLYSEVVVNRGSTVTGIYRADCLVAGFSGFSSGVRSTVDYLWEQYLL